MSNAATTRNNQPKAKSSSLGGTLTKGEAKARAEQSRRDKAAARSVAAQSTSRKLATITTSRAAKSNLNRVEHDLLLAITDPSASECRYPGVGDEPIVPFAFGPTYNVDFSGATHSGDEIADQQCVIIKRSDSLLCDSIIWQKTVSTASVYTGVFRTVNASTGSGSLSSAETRVIPIATQVEVAPIYLGYTSGDDLHGDEQFPGYDTDLLEYYLMSKGSTLAFTITNDVYNGQFQIWARDGEGRSVVASSGNLSASTANNIAFIIPYTGWYRVTTSQLSSSFATWTFSSFRVTAPTTQGAFRQLAVQDIADQLDEIGSFRVLGASILCTQASSVTNMNGRGIQIQVPSGRDLTVAMKQSFTDYAQTNTRMFTPRDLYEGLYSYKKPADRVVDFRLRNEWEADASGVLVYASFPIVSDAPMLVFYLNVPTAAGRVFTYQPGCSINCSSDSAWKDLEAADGDALCTDRVLACLRGVPQHMENETHSSFISQLADMALTAAPFLGSYGPGVATTAGLVKSLATPGMGGKQKRAPKGLPA